MVAAITHAEGSLSFDFHTRPVPLNLLLANRLRGAATGDNLKRILSETELGVNRSEKILKVIRLCQVDIIIAFNTLPFDMLSRIPRNPERSRGSPSDPDDFIAPQLPQVVRPMLCP
jgi:hypothetical protein